MSRRFFVECLICGKRYQIEDVEEMERYVEGKKLCKRCGDNQWGFYEP